MADSRTVFKRVEYELSGLLHYIEIGDIGLPDIQRPFVWSAAKVRDLFDSMFKGFPVGYLLFWVNAGSDTTRQIGLERKGHSVPRLLIVDGQQRLTSLFAVFRGQPVLDEDYKAVRLRIAFRPRDGRFEVSDAFVSNDPEFIPDISELWASNKSSHRLVKEFLDRLRKTRELSDDDEEIVSHNLDRLFDIQRYPFTALEVSPDVDEEKVADIFVRINSQGERLNQADFLLTLLSVFWEEGRKELEAFSRQSRIPPGRGANASPYNHFIAPSPEQLLRVTVALAFSRGRLKAIYPVLRGKDLETDTYSAEKRDEQFAKLKEAQSVALNLTYWHQFLSALVGAGFRSYELISSENSLLYAYVFYLIGRTRYHVAEHVLQRLIGRWFYASTLTGRYTGSPETVMDGDLSRVADLGGADAYVAVLNKIIEDSLTADFWRITLPNDLESSSARSPAMSAYLAAQNLLAAPVLFSHKRISDLLDPSVVQRKRSLERHHLFPRAWLQAQGVRDVKLINQTANMAFLEWPENIEISDGAPSEYVPIMRGRFDETTWTRMCKAHALPPDWEALPYDDFLRQRRQLMAAVVEDGFRQVGSAPSPAYAPPSEAPAAPIQLDEENGDDDDSPNPRVLERRNLRYRFWVGLLEKARAVTSLHSRRSPTRYSWLGTGGGLRGVSLNYALWEHESAVELYIDRGKDTDAENKQIFDALAADREAIEAAFGGPLEWERLDSRRASRIRATSADGGFRDEPRWPAIQDAMIKAMVNLEAALRPRLERLALD
jgi:hypothetical protein